MRRLVLALLVLGAAATVGASVYTAYATDRDYTRFISAGDEALAADQATHALEAYSGAIISRPDSMLAHLKRGITYRRRGDLEAALRDLRKASALDPTATLPLELAGDTSLELGRANRAVERYETYVSLDDRSAAVWYKLGLARYRAGRQSAALDALTRALALDKGMAEALTLRGLCLRDAGNRDEAIRSLQSAATLAPGATGPREALAEIFADAGQHARAVDQLEALAALDPARPERSVALGLAYAQARRHEAAVLTLTRAVERFPSAPAVYAALGHVWLQAYETTGDRTQLDKALEALGVATSHADADGRALADLGRARLAAGDTAAAERAFLLAVARQPVPPDAYLALATIAERKGQARDARDQLVRYVTLASDGEPSSAVATRIARLSLAAGQADIALRWIDRAIEDGGATPALANLRARAAHALTTR